MQPPRSPRSPQSCCGGYAQALGGWEQISAPLGEGAAMGLCCSLPGALAGAQTDAP